MGVRSLSVCDKYPDRCPKLVLASTQVIGLNDPEGEAIIKAKRSGDPRYSYDYEYFSHQGRLDNEEEMTAFYYGTAALGFYDPRPVPKSLASHDFPLSPYAGRNQHAADRKAESQVPLLSKISAGTLVIVGSDDDRTPVVLFKKVHSAISKFILVVVPQAGHNSPLNQPSIWCREVRSHFQGNEDLKQS
jgi:pimeloyl-ACP methyl ester carboxylesterase